MRPFRVLTTYIEGHGIPEEIHEFATEAEAVVHAEAQKIADKVREVKLFRRAEDGNPVPHTPEPPAGEEQEGLPEHAGKEAEADQKAKADADAEASRVAAEEAAKAEADHVAAEQAAQQQNQQDHHETAGQ